MNTNAYEDLAYIRELMADTRQAAGVSGGYFILWGLVVGIALVATWLQIVGTVPYRPLLTWGPCIGLGLLGNFIMIWLDMRRPVQSRAVRLIGTVWLALGITQFILFIASLGFNSLPGIYMPGIISCVLGSGIFITGVLAGLQWLRNLAFAWWLGALAMFALPGEHVPLLMGVMLLLFYVVPGIVLIKQQRGQAMGEI